MATKTITGRGIGALAGLLFGALVLSACETDDGPVASAPDIEACLNDSAPAQSVMRHCQKVLDSETVSVAERATAYTRIGFGHLALARHTEAVAAFEQATVLMPRLKGAHLGLGWAQLRLLDLDAAKQAFDHVLVLDPNLTSAREGRGIVHLVNQDYRLSIDDFDKVLASNPNSTRARRNRGDAYFALGRHDQALADYDAVIALVEVAQPELFLTRSQILAAKGERTDPREDWATALRAAGPEQIGAWQKRMLEGGFYAGAVDGKLSPATRDALATCMADKDCRRVN